MRSERQLAPKPAATPKPVSAVLQRKCTCGGSADVESECEQCKSERMSLQRRAHGGAAAPTAVPPIVHDVVRSPGQPLDAATRAFMEPRFGHDFSKVRVHADQHAAESARAVSALAYTVGNDVVFNSGHYRPGTSSGRKLLTHELAHVVQQSGRGAGGSATSLRVDETGEADADRVATNVAEGRHVGSVAPASETCVQRDDLDDAYKYVQSQSRNDPALRGGEPQPRNEDSQDAFYASLIQSGVSLQKSVEHTHWSSPQERSRFIEGYLRYTKSHGLDKEYAEASEAYPSRGKPELQSPPGAAGPIPARRQPANKAGTPPAIANLPYRERPVRMVQFKRLGFLGMSGLITVTPAQPTIQKGPDPSAGYNFDTYLLNAEGGEAIPAQWLGGTRYRVLMGTPECPGCHFGRGIEIDLAGEHPLFIAGQMALGGAPIAAEMFAAEDVGQLDALASSGKPPATTGRLTVDPDISAQVEQSFQEHGGAAPKTITPSGPARPTPALVKPAQILESEGAAPRSGQFQSASAQTARSLKTAIRADIGEVEAYKVALAQREIGLQRPGGANLPGEDFITAGRNANGEMVVYVNDAKTSTIGKFPKPETGPLPRTWQQAVQDAVGPQRLKLPNNAQLEAEIRDAVAKGRVVRRQVNVNYSPAGQGTIEFK